MSAAQSVPCADDPLAAAQAGARSAYEAQVYPLLSAYCLKCHGAEKHKGDIDFSTMASGGAALANRPVWKTCAEKLLAREMPPDKETKQPSDAERETLRAWMAGLKRLAPRDPGAAPIRRLSQAEYANTLHDLLGVDRKVAADLPADVVGEGFSSSISPLLMEKYLLVADEVLDEAIKPEQLTLRWAAGQLDAIVGGKTEPGKPDGAERRIAGPGELTAVIPAPIDGTYSIRIKASAERATGKEPARLAVRIDNQVVGEIKVTGSAKFPSTSAISCKLAAGRAHLSVLMANPYLETGVEADRKKPGEAAKPPEPQKPPAKSADKQQAADKPADQGQVRVVTIETIEVIGPPAALPSETQKRLFVAMPGKDLAKREAAKRIAESFARRAFRRPPTAAEIEVLLSVFDLADSQDEVFTEAVKLMLKATLVSPQFLFITGDESASSDRDIVAIDDHQLAAKLSYLFWSTMPDDELAALADAGKLHDPAVVAQQVRRLVADPRSRTLFDGFGAHWLGLDRLGELAIDETKYPLMTKELRKGMYEEAAMLFDTILRDNRSMLEFLDNDYTFLNGALAKIYGLEATVKGPQMRRVQLDDRNRGGVMTLPGVLAVTSLPNRTSPVKRGRWVLAEILGQEPPPPPMNVAPLEKQNTAENVALNLRQRTERHRSDPACAGCHRVLDPIGFGLENFDPIGRWRDKDDTGCAVDAVGELPGKQSFASPADLKRIIAARKDDFCHTLVAKLLAYALCRHLDGYDEVVADEIAAAVARDGYRFQTAMVQIATSYPFLNRHVRH